ncbi:hypothetical protein ACJ41O_014800 [Fusarium nematophilum]
MTGTVIITGANGSLALGFATHLLTHHPSHTLLLTVRDASPSDPNTSKLAHIIQSSSSPSTAHIEPLDLSSLSSVRSFADRTAQRVAKGEIPPIKAIACNAFAWSLSGQQLFTPDGFERTFQVGHLAHYLLVLKLLGSMAPDGRIVLLGSTAHYPENANPLSKLVAEFPDDVERLVRPLPDEAGQEHDRGFQRYGTMKLANVMLMHDLNSMLERDPKLSSITATAMDPGGLIDSRGHSAQKPTVRAIFWVMNLLLPLLKHITSDFRRSADAGRDLAELCVGDGFQGARGYYIGVKPAEPAKSSRDVEKRRILWKACWEWAGMGRGETVLDVRPDMGDDCGVGDEGY